VLRAALPEARIGCFLHIPFPSSEVFRILPWRREILAGLLGADLLGFHTFAYMRHFVASLLHVEGVEVDIDRLVVGDREVRLGAFPMGVDAEGLDALARDPGVDSYQRFRRQVEEGVGHINGAYGTLRSTPVHYLHRSVSRERLVALYCAADVMLVTPLRDGMNLVAKEFVASRVNDDDVLLLSEFAGASAELDGAVVVNPYDVDAVAESLHRALSKAAPERRTRMQGLRRRVQEHDVHAWARGFIDALERARPFARRPLPVSDAELHAVLVEARRTAPVRLLLDYDGTLVPFAQSPELAAPDEDVIALLRALAARPDVAVDIVSGRPPDTLDAWFGDLAISLWAEHGFWHRPLAERRWEAAAPSSQDWIARVRPILTQFTTSTPGSRIEEKTASIAWHYRGAPREFGARQAHELRMLLDALDAGSNLDPPASLSA